MSDTASPASRVESKNATSVRTVSGDGTIRFDVPSSPAGVHVQGVELTFADAGAFGVTVNSLADTYEWAFQWGPGLVAGIGNGLMLGYLMYRSELVPRRMAMLGLIGGPVLILSHVLILCEVYKNGEGPSGLLTLPEAAWELSLGIYCAWKGFRPSPVTVTTPTIELHRAGKIKILAAASPNRVVLPLMKEPYTW